MEGNTRFQWDLLSVVADIGPAKGLEIKAVVETRFEKYDEDINNARLYPNLDSLAGRGFIEKRKHDGRTNMYTVTEKAHRELQERIRKLSGDVV